MLLSAKLIHKIYLLKPSALTKFAIRFPIWLTVSKKKKKDISYDNNMQSLIITKKLLIYFEKLSQSCPKFKRLIYIVKQKFKFRLGNFWSKEARIHASADNILVVVQGSASSRKRAGGALYCRYLRSKARGLAQVGKYRSTGYVWRQSHHNLRRVRCTSSWGTIHAHSSFAVRHRQPVNFPLASKGTKAPTSCHAQDFYHDSDIFPVESNFLTGTSKEPRFLKYRNVYVSL